jgi:erythronate-4-phosphate dehydrogenase
MKISPITTVGQHSMTWVELALACYNPILETQELKAATNKKNAFLSQRKAHQCRHDFNRYDLTGFDKQVQPIMGASIKNN